MRLQVRHSPPCSIQLMDIGLQFANSQMLNSEQRFPPPAEMHYHEQGRGDRRSTVLMRAVLAGLCWLAPVIVAVVPAWAQSGADRPGGDYARFTIPSGDPAACAARCDRDARCRAWTFSYPGTSAIGGSQNATCWLKSEVRSQVENPCCVTGVKGGGLPVQRPGPIENSIDRYGGDYRHFELPSDPKADVCKQACEAEDRCRAWTYVRPGYIGRTARCYLKEKITRPRRKPCCVSGVVR
jgi:hypothetical protein